MAAYVLLIHYDTVSLLSISRKPFISPHQSAVVCSLLTHHDDLAHPAADQSRHDTHCILVHSRPFRRVLIQPVSCDFLG